MGRDSEQSCRFKISLGNALGSLAGGLKLHALRSAERCHTRASYSNAMQWAEPTNSLWSLYRISASAVQRTDITAKWVTEGVNKLVRHQSRHAVPYTKIRAFQMRHHSDFIVMRCCEFLRESSWSAFSALSLFHELKLFRLAYSSENVFCLETILMP